jgi:hypothetical protein
MFLVVPAAASAGFLNHLEVSNETAEASASSTQEPTHVLIGPLHSCRLSGGFGCAQGSV